MLQVSDEKAVQILSLHFVPGLRSVVHILNLVDIFLPGLQSALCTDRIGIAVFVRASLKSGPKYRGSKRDFSETILAAMIDVWTVYWRVPVDKHNDRAIIRSAHRFSIALENETQILFSSFFALCSEKTKLHFHFRFSFFLVGKETEFEFT